tara:strand:- start:1901 stop:4828 length:2928 start_codon:yes stop_codon:yes gene_type:complete
MSDAEILIAIRSDGRGARVVKGELESIADSGERATKQTERLNSRMKGLSSTASLLKGAFAGLIASLGVREIARAADEFVLLEARIKNSTRSTQEFKFAMDELRSISGQTGASLQSAVEVFQRLSFTRDEISATVEEMTAFTGSVQKLGVVSGASTGALNAGLTQLGQALSSDVTRAEEFNSILENIPAVAVTIAKEFGVTTGQLRNLVIEGEVASKDVFAAILNQSQDINAQFEQFPQTIGRAFNNLILRTKDSVGEFDRLTGSSNAFISSLDVIGKAIQALVGMVGGSVNVFKGMFSALTGGILTAFSGAIKLIQETINLGIKGINVFKKDKIALLDFAPNVSSVFEVSVDDALGKFKSAAEAYKSAFKSGQSIFNGDQNYSTPEAESRNISKDYAALADGLTETNQGFKEANSEAKKLTKEIKDPMTDAVSDMAREIDRDFAGAFKDAFSDTAGGFKRLVEGMKSSFMNFLGEIAYQATIRPIVLSLGIAGGSMGMSSQAMAQIAGGGTGSGSGFGGIGNMLSMGKNLLTGLNTPIFGAGSMIGSGINSIGATLGLNNSSFVGPMLPGTSNLASAFTPGAALAGFGGNMLGNFIFGGNRGIGSTVGGTLGGVAGTALGGPVGAAIGSFLGNAVGGLFGGKKPSDKYQGGTISLENFERDTFGQSGKKFSQQNSDYRDNILNQIEQLSMMLSSSGASLGGSIGIGVGNRDGLRLKGPSGVNNFGYNQEAFIKGINDAVIASASGMSKNLSQALKKTDTGNIQAITDTIALVNLIDGFGAETVPPLTSALNELSKQFDDLKGKASDLGLPVDELTASYQKQKDAIIQNSLRPLQDFLDQQALSGSSSLNPGEQLSLARSKFDTNLDAVKLGDYSNIDALTQQASQLLNIGRDVFASGEGFAALESYVRQSIVGVGDSLGAEGGLNDSVARDIAVSNAEQTSIMQQVVLELQELREENRKLRKEQERTNNKLVMMK